MEKINLTPILSFRAAFNNFYLACAQATEEAKKMSEGLNELAKSPVLRNNLKQMQSVSRMLNR